MKNFYRVISIALRYRVTLAGLFMSALLVACFWGANFGMVYPIVGVVLKQHSLRDWVDENIATSTARHARLQAVADQCQSKLAAMPDSDSEQRHALTQEYRTARSAARAEMTALTNAKRARPWIYRYMPAKPFPTLAMVVMALMIGTIIKTVFLITGVVLVERLTQLVIFDLRKQLYRRTLNLSLSHFGEGHTSTLVSRFTHDMDGITEGVRTIFGRAVREPLKVVACFIGAGIVCWRLLVFCLIVTPVAIFLINRLARSVKRANRRAMEEMAGVYSHLSESFQGIQIVKAFTMERHERRTMHQHSKDYFRKSLRIAVYHSMAKPITEVMSIGVVCLAILAGGYLVLNEETSLLGITMCQRPLTFEALMTFFVLLAGVSDPFRKLSDVFNQIQRGAAAADRVYSVIDRQSEISHQPHPIVAIPTLQRLAFEQVDFAYGSEKLVVRDVTLEIPAGKRVAIVGPNGCGKSTLINLISRFYDPVRGVVRWNDLDVRDMHLRELRKRIGVVTQQALLFDDTILSNIRYGSPFATDREVIAAAKKAHAHQFIEQQLAQGYQTRAGQGGKSLSGGQRQRIALARAILRDPELLVLDEATSQIDVESEHLIHRALEEFTRDRTTIMVTHRHSTLSLADLVVVMDAGRIVDSGTHADLMRRCSLYQRLNQIDLRASA